MTLLLWAELVATVKLVLGFKDTNFKMPKRTWSVLYKQCLPLKRIVERRVKIQESRLKSPYLGYISTILIGKRTQRQEHMGFKLRLNFKD